TVLSIFSGLAVAIGLGLYAMQQNINLFYPPSKVSEAPTNVLIRVGGLVVKDSVKRDPDSLEVEFQLTDNEGDIRVLYDGILPDLFREGQGIVTMGKLQENGDFVASEVLAKHDENYMSPEIAEAIKQAEAKAMKRGSEP
ncbi:MAG: cytochrome c maturation protein CcmE, partial [Gammaproteobacteria bacterium]